MLRGAHSEHATAIWGINVHFFGYTEHTSAIWRIALQIVLQWHTTDVLRRLCQGCYFVTPNPNGMPGAHDGPMEDSLKFQTSGSEHRSYLSRIAPESAPQASK